MLLASRTETHAPEPALKLMKLITKLVVAAVSLSALAATARAIPTLTLKDLMGGGSLVINGDPSGVISYNGSFSNWVVNVSTGISEAPSGELGLDLNSIDKSTGQGKLQITFSDDSFMSPSSGSVSANIGGGIASGGSLLYETSLNGTQTTSQLFTGNPFSGSAKGAIVTYSTPFTLTQSITISHDATGTSSFNATATVPDGGTTALLLGLGLLGTGLIFGKRRFA